MYLTMQAVNSNQFRNVIKMFIENPIFFRIFLILAHEFPYIFNTKGGNERIWIFKVSNLAVALCCIKHCLLFYYWHTFLSNDSKNKICSLQWIEYLMSCLFSLYDLSPYPTTCTYRLRFQKVVSEFRNIHDLISWIFL